MVKIIFVADLEWVGQRLDKALAQLPQISSRTRASQIIDAGGVTLQSKVMKASAIIVPGAVYEISLPEPAITQIVPLKIDLDIVFQDQDLLVINKPAGLVVHPAAGHAQDTLVNALVHSVPDLKMGFGDRRPGIVHRLDKDTSGLLVVAKNDVAQAHLVEQFKARSVHRLYWALVYGEPKPKKSRIESLLARHPKHRTKYASLTTHSDRAPAGKRAITNYELKGRFANGYCLVHCKLETGRTHQIRVHMSEFGHPIVGDILYGAGAFVSRVKDVTFVEKIKAMKRIGLHAAELGFQHPRTGEALHFTAAWPDDLVGLVSGMEAI